MKSRILTLCLIIFILVLCPFFSVQGAKKHYDFRKIRWGMSPKEVIKAEWKRPALKKTNVLVYNLTIKEKEFVLKYQFIKGKLVRAVYQLGEQYMNEYKYITDYELFKQVLTGKYGKPKQDKYIWIKGDFLKGNKYQWGVAVSLGNLTCLSTFENKATRISNLLTGGNYSVSYIIEYNSKEFEYLLKPNNGSPDESDSSDENDGEINNDMQRIMNDF